MKNTWKRAFVWCTMVFLTLAAVIAFYFLLQNGSSIMKTVHSIFGSLTSIWIGIGMAYVLDPIIVAGERFLRKKNMKQIPARVLTIVAVLALIVLLVFLICSRLIPRLFDTINSLLSDLPGMQATFNSYLDRVNEWNPQVYEYIINVISFVTDWINTNLYTTINTITQSFLSVINGIVNLFVGLIVLVYAQMSKERFIGQAKKLLYAVCHHRGADTWILDIFRQANLIFSGFITGKIIDSAIVGVICFVCLSFLKIPYSLLISVVIGVTNIIPVFGPFIGAIPCGILLLFVNPWDCLVFVIFILILQQIDGNIIGPRILGNSTGVSAFWVIVAILVFSNLLGIIGMIVGVPIFATLYYIVKRIVEEELARQNLPTDSMDYVRLERIDENNQLIYMADDAVKKKSLAKRRSPKEVWNDTRKTAMLLKNAAERKYKELKNRPRKDGEN
ncbi:MAG: AI-2E family transporter [Lachnospiraceae bacterium]|nr:AI-2E family transporter [Lachnospiraceae bacterium]